MLNFKRQGWWIILFSLFFTGLSLYPTKQQGQTSAAEPTLQETIEYINTKFDQCGEVKSEKTLTRNRVHETRTTQASIKYSGSGEISLDLKILRKVTFKKFEVDRMHLPPIFTDGRIDDSTIAVRVKLRDLSPEVVVKKGKVFLSCTIKNCMQMTNIGFTSLTKDIIKFYYGTEDELKEGKWWKIDLKYKTSKHDFEVCEEARIKIRKAFIHAIKISGGKELF